MFEEKHEETRLSPEPSITGWIDYWMDRLLDGSITGWMMDCAFSNEPAWRRTNESSTPLSHTPLSIRTSTFRS